MKLNYAGYRPIVEDGQTHTVSIEILRHYRCGACGLWWSVADETNAADTRHCPHCGTCAKVEGVE